MLDPVESAISAAYTDWVEGYEVTHSSHDQVRGTFLGQEGIVYSFKIDPQGVEFQESRQDTAEFNDYFLAQLHSAGADYHGDSAYAYWQGLVGADVRMDRAAAKCKTGVPCNGRCLPKGRKCRSQGGGLKQGGNPGLKRNLAVLGGAALAGGAIAGGASILGRKQAQKAKYGKGESQGADSPETAAAKARAKERVAAPKKSVDLTNTAAAQEAREKAIEQKLNTQQSQNISAAAAAAASPKAERRTRSKPSSRAIPVDNRSANISAAASAAAAGAQPKRKSLKPQDISAAAASAAVPRKKTRGRPPRRPIPQG